MASLSSTTPKQSTASSGRRDPPDPWSAAPQSKLWDASKSKWKAHEQGSVPMRLSAVVAAEDWRVACEEVALRKLLITRARKHSLLTQEQATKLRVAGVGHATELAAAAAAAAAPSSTTTTDDAKPTITSRGVRYG